MANRIIIMTILTLSLSSCSQLPSMLAGATLGGGTNVAANTQVGKENTQNYGLNSSLRPQLRLEAPVDTVIQDTSTTKNTEIDPLMLILLILGWLAPSPHEIFRGVLKLFRRR